MFYIRMMVHTEKTEDPHLETVASGETLADAWKRAAKHFVAVKKDIPNDAAYEEAVKKFKEPKVVVPKRKIVLVK